MYICACMCVYIHIYTHTYTHIHTHISLAQHKRRRRRSSGAPPSLLLCKWLEQPYVLEHGFDQMKQLLCLCNMCFVVSFKLNEDATAPRGRRPAARRRPPEVQYKCIYKHKHIYIYIYT